MDLLIEESLENRIRDLLSKINHQDFHYSILKSTIQILKKRQRQAIYYSWSHKTCHVTTSKNISSFKTPI